MSEKPSEGLTSADIKKQIEEAQQEAKKTDLKESGLPLTGMIANEINASESTPAATPPADSKPQPETPAAETKTVEQSTDFKEWAKKKGIDWTTDDNVLAALHKSDQLFHQRQSERKAKEEQIRSSTPPPYQPPVNYPPAYVPAQNQRQILEELARAEGMTPEDFEKVARVSRQVYEAAAQADRAKQAQLDRAFHIERERNTVFRELSSDPVFRRPEVAIEFHTVLDQMQTSDPVSFEQNPSAYKRAFEIALSNIGRRNLEGQRLQEGVSPAALPIKPPRALGQGSGGGALDNENGIDMAAFNKLSVKEQRASLERAGLIAGY